MKIIPLHKNEQKLIESALKNNRQAQQVLYELYASKMLSVCRMYIGDLQHAEDTMLKGFYKVFTKLKNFKQTGSFEGWIRKIMIREAIDFLRSHKKNEFPNDQLEKQAKAEASNILEDATEEAYLQHLIDSLPEGYKTVFILYAIEGYKHHEIAKMLQIAEGTSKSQLAKARKILQEKVRDKKTTYHEMG